MRSSINLLSACDLIHEQQVTTTSTNQVRIYYTCTPLINEISWDVKNSSSSLSTKQFEGYIVTLMFFVVNILVCV